VSDLANAAEALETFTRGNLRERIASIEQTLLSDGLNWKDEAVTIELLMAALRLKRAAGQINTIIHAIGIVLLLPDLLDKDEKLESLSIGAGNRGKKGKGFDLVTSKRIAEFTFIQWQGEDSARQRKLLGDFRKLAECETSKRKYLYVLGTLPLRFLAESQKSIENGPRVRDYYDLHKELVRVENIEPILLRRGIPQAFLSPVRSPKRTLSPRVRRQYDVFGYPATAVIRWMGKNEWTFSESRAALNGLGNVEVSDATIRTQLRAGRKGERGPAAPLTDAEAQELAAFRRR
jgi:hypothetical protein